MDHLEFLRTIGRKGGNKRKTNPLRIEMARNAALARWKRKPSMPEKHNQHNNKVYSNDK